MIKETAPMPQLWQAQLPDRPLAGLTVMLVEDSRFASEALRLLCLRSGARIRRADCMESAQRHLRTYRAGVIIVDLGLPDGNGADLIAQIKSQNLAPVVLGISGDPGAEDAAMAAGADGFLHKPVESLALFQARLLALLPAARKRGPRLLPDEVVTPGGASLHDDLSHADALLTVPSGAETLDYAIRFLSSVARSSHDVQMAELISQLGDERGAGTCSEASLARLRGMVKERLFSVGGAC
ncbi:MAG: response regulator [Paracoccus sp. (in: a-proteobacteria)]|nr:response regulator [Paracoccus sp. (in: a-proteobacteria)]